MNYTKEKIEILRHRWTTRKGKQLVKIVKNSRCYLSPVLFRQKIKNFPGINDEEVEDGIDLRGAPLSGFDFRVPVQEDDDGFTEDIAILSSIHFEGAILKHCSFQDGKIHDCFFEDADLTHAQFKNASLNTCNFQQADCTGMDIHGAKLTNCSFVEAVIKDMTTSSALIDQKTEWGKELKSEKDENFHFASIEYKQIRGMYKNSTLHELADLFHHKEMKSKRRQLKWYSPTRWMNFIFGDLLCKYGTSFGRVIIASALVMVACAGLYTKNNSLLFHNQPFEAGSFLDSLYFSIVTFTTLGYGDFHAVGALRYVAAIESFVGAALMALFTVIVARNLIRD